jgi:hypothetical protein
MDELEVDFFAGSAVPYASNIVLSGDGDVSTPSFSPDLTTLLSATNVPRGVLGNSSSFSPVLSFGNGFSSFAQNLAGDAALKCRSHQRWDVGERQQQHTHC